jgi:hypothetical protein
MLDQSSPTRAIPAAAAAARGLPERSLSASSSCPEEIAELLKLPIDSDGAILGALGWLLLFSVLTAVALQWW